MGVGKREKEEGTRRRLRRALRAGVTVSERGP
jgi:hypothetical protein